MRRVGNDLLDSWRGVRGVQGPDGVLMEALEFLQEDDRSLTFVYILRRRFEVSLGGAACHAPPLPLNYLLMTAFITPTMFILVIKVSQLEVAPPLAT